MVSLIDAVSVTTFFIDICFSEIVLSVFSSSRDSGTTFSASGFFYESTSYGPKSRTLNFCTIRFRDIRKRTRIGVSQRVRIPYYVQVKWTNIIARK
jgi:hypothetical protein